MNRKSRQFLTSLNSAFVVAALLVTASPARAGDVLFVSDTLTDANNIPFVLSGGSEEVAHPSIAGAFFREAASQNHHDVTIIRNDYEVTGGEVFLAEGTNPALAGVRPGVTLADYCSVFWSASGPHDPDLFGGGLGADGGLHADPTVFTSLGTYVEGGGYVFVTGHDAAADPNDPLLEAFIGGTGAVAVQQVRATPNSFFTTVSGTGNALAVGLFDISGRVPGGDFPGGVNSLDGAQDLDYIAGTDALEVTGVVAEPSAAGGFMWTERVPLANGGAAAASDFGNGRIAYVSNGIFFLEDLPFDGSRVLSDGEDASWRNDEAYRGALVNFAFNACADADVTVPDVEGLSQAAAEAAIIAEGLTVGTVTTANSDTVPAGDVISQNPAAGDSVPRDTAVDLVVSLGPAPRMCDVDADGDIDINDIRAILAVRNQPASGPDDPRDADGDGVITVLDARTCTARCDLPRCAPVP